MLYLPLCYLKNLQNKDELTMELLLVRHGFSKGNEDIKTHHSLPDHIIPLTDKGIEQAHQAANKVQKYLQDKYDFGTCIGGRLHHEVRLWSSPYVRTRQTADAFNSIVWKDNCCIITDRREDIALCEQQFGLFDGLSDLELKDKYPNEHEHYTKCEKFGGRFWARMPLGESRFDVTLRVQQVFGTWQRDLEKHGIETVVVVSHGVTIRAILMRWLHLPFEWFEQEPNPKNCSVRVISCGEDLGYL